MTTGYELTTGITNMFIVISSLLAFFKTKDKTWKTFFMLVTIDSMLGVTIHCFLHPALTKKILWMILTGTFSVTINTLLLLFIKDKFKKLNMKHVIIVSILFYLILLIEVIFNKNYLLTFILYALACMLIITYMIIKYGIKKNKYYALGVLMQYIGGIPMIVFNKHDLTGFPLVDQNGIYHIFMVFTVLFFLKENKSKNL